MKLFFASTSKLITNLISSQSVSSTPYKHSDCFQTLLLNIEKNGILAEINESTNYCNRPPIEQWHVYMYMMCWRDEIPSVTTDNREAARWTLSRLLCAFDGSELFVLKQPKQLTLGLPLATRKPILRYADKGDVHMKVTHDIKETHFG